MFYVELAFGRTGMAVLGLAGEEQKSLTRREHIAHLAGDCPISLVKQEHWGNQTRQEIAIGPGALV